MASAETYAAWQLATRAGGPGPEKLVKMQVPRQPLGPKQVRVLTSRTTATYTDLLILQGNYPTVFPTPVTPGYDVVGVVGAVGTDVASLRPGDVVAAMPQHGGFAEEIVLDADKCYALPGGINLTEAVALPLTGMTAYQMLERSSGDRLTKPGASILVHGCVGGTGAMLVALTKALHPDVKIFGTCSARNLDVALSAGVTAIDYSANGGRWETRVRELNGGKGVDVLCDHVLTEGYVSKGLRVLVPGGKYIAYGMTNTKKPGGVYIPSVLVAFATLGLQKWVWGCVDHKEAEFTNVAGMKEAHPDWYRTDLAVLVELVRAGKLKLTEGSREWAFDEAPQALQGIAASTHRGKQVIVVRR